MNSLCQKW